MNWMIWLKHKPSVASLFISLFCFGVCFALASEWLERPERPKRATVNGEGTGHWLILDGLSIAIFDFYWNAKRKCLDHDEFFGNLNVLRATAITSVLYTIKYIPFMYNVYVYINQAKKPRWNTKCICLNIVFNLGN